MGSLRACLERVDRLSQEPLSWLEARLRDLVSMDVDPDTLCSSRVNASGLELASSLLHALAQRTGKQLVAESTGVHDSSGETMLVEKTIQMNAASLLAWLQLQKLAESRPSANGTRRKACVALLVSILCFLFRLILRHTRSRSSISMS